MRSSHEELDKEPLIFIKITPVLHEISAREYADEIARLVSILETGGYSTKGMDFSDIVAKKLGDIFAETVRARGVAVKNHSWEKKYDQSLRIKVYCFDAP